MIVVAVSLHKYATRGLYSYIHVSSLSSFHDYWQSVNHQWIYSDATYLTSQAWVETLHPGEQTGQSYGATENKATDVTNRYMHIDLKSKILDKKTNRTENKEHRVI